MKAKFFTLFMVLFAFVWSARADEIYSLDMVISHNGGETFSVSPSSEGWKELVLSGQTTSLKIYTIVVQASESVSDIAFVGTMYSTGGQPDGNEWRSYSLEYRSGGKWVLSFGEGIDLVEDKWIGQNKTKTFEFYIQGKDAFGSATYYNNGGENYKVTFSTGDGGGSSTEGIKSFKLTINCDGEVFTQSFPSEGWPSHTIDGQTSSIKILRAEVETGGSMTSVGFCWTIYDAADGWQHDDSAWGWMNLENKGGGHWEYDWGEGLEFVESEWLTDSKTKTLEFFVKAWDKDGNEYKHTNGINEQGYDNNYKVTFSTGNGGGGEDWKVKFYKEGTASLSLRVNGEGQSYVFDGDGTRLPDTQPGDAYSLVIDGFHLSFIHNDNVSVNEVSLQYKVYEEGQDGWWNRLDAMQTYSQDIYNPEKDRVDHKVVSFAEGLGQEIAAGLEFGKSYVLEIMYQVIADKEYFFLARDKEGGKFKFYYDTETGIRQIANSKSSNNQLYNLSCQRVGRDYKGIVVTGGRKALVK